MGSLAQGQTGDYTRRQREACLAHVFGAFVLMLALYSAALALALLAGAPWFLYQALRRQKYAGSLRERLGALPVSLNLDGEPSIWIHAVSVGEVLAARPLAD